MRRCPRCGRWHHSTDSETCTACWEAIGQMQFWQDDDEYEPDIDTVFDREEEAKGYQ